MAKTHHLVSRLNEGDHVAATGGVGTSTTAGGNVTLSGGAAQGSGAGGNVILTPGVPAGAGAAGNVIVTVPTADPHVVGALWSSSGTIHVSAG